MAGQQDQNQNIVFRFFKGLWKLFRRLVFTIGLMFLISVITVTITVAKISDSITTAKPLPAKMLLTYTFKDGMSETTGQPRFDRSFFSSEMTIAEFIRAMDRAAVDNRVVGFAATLDGLNLSVAQVQEIRDAISRFRKSGKPATIFAPSYGGMGDGMGDYYLASSFDDIWMQPVGMVGIGGIAAQVPFFKDVLDKIGVEAQFVHKGIYKSAPESLTSTGMTPPTRENMTTLVNDLSAQIYADIASARKIADPQMSDAQQQSPFTDRAALQAKLIDNLGYADQMLEAANAKAGHDAKTVEFETYSRKTAPRKSSADMRRDVMKIVNLDANEKAPPKNKKPADKIALIIGAGEISASAGSSGFGEGGITADKISEVFAAAEKNDEIGAVVFRIDSPGGSPEASETIRRAMMQVQKKGKPVVVSMGGYAASGGYWIASAGDKIVAQPGTITGSIGVFGGKMVLAGLWEKLGIRFETVNSREGADMWSANRKFTDAEYAKYDALLDNIYDAFLTRVADGRKMPKAQVAQLAEGRVYSGREAREKGLVDELGGIDTAVAIAKQLAGFKPDQDVPLVIYPPKRTPLRLFMDMASGEASLPMFRITAEDIMRVVMEMPKTAETINCCK